MLDSYHAHILGTPTEAPKRDETTFTLQVVISPTGEIAKVDITDQAKPEVQRLT